MKLKNNNTMKVTVRRVFVFISLVFKEIKNKLDQWKENNPGEQATKKVR
jgi:hypothetical protein